VRRSPYPWFAQKEGKEIARLLDNGFFGGKALIWGHQLRDEEYTPAAATRIGWIERLTDHHDER
jgi:hypothetical protein